MKKLSSIIVGVALLISCNQRGKDAALLQQQRTNDSLTHVIERQKILDSIKLARQHEQAIRNEQRAQTIRHEQGQRTDMQTAGYEEPQKKKKGWSAKTKGAVIGAGVGAVTGAIVHKKNRVVGAVVGGAVGSGAGYGAGAVVDSKKKKEGQ